MRAHLLKFFLRVLALVSHSWPCSTAPMASPPSMSHPETIYPAPASYERAQAALAALDTARESLRSSEYSEADQRTGGSSHQRRARAPAASAREASPRALAARPIARPHAHPSIRDASATRSSQRSAGWRMSWGRRGRSGGRSRRSGRCWRSSIGRTSSGETRFTSLREPLLLTALGLSSPLGCL